MKMKYLMIPVLATLVLTGCGKKNQPQPEPQPEPEAVEIDTNSEEGKAKVNSVLDKTTELYSNPTNFKAAHIAEKVEGVNFNLGLAITETSKYGLNEVELSFSDIAFEGDQYARVGEDRSVEGMVNIRKLEGKHAASIAVLQPLTGQKEGEEKEGVFASGAFDIAQSNINAYFKGGKGYFDLSDEGIRTTLNNANELANEGYRAYEEINAKMEEMNKPQQSQPQPQPLREAEPEPQGLDLNAMLDQYVGSSRKFQTVIEENGFIIPEEDYQAATEEEVAEAKAEINDAVNNVLPSLVAAQVMKVSELKEGGLKIEANVNKEKVVNVLPIIQDYVEAKEAENNTDNAIQQAQLPLRAEEPEQPAEPTWAEMFDQFVSKFDIKAEILIDKDGYFREFAVEYGIEAGAEKYPYNFFGLTGEITANLSLAGKINASIQYNDEVSFALPEEIEQYAVVNFDD